MRHPKPILFLLIKLQTTDSIKIYHEYSSFYFWDWKNVNRKLDKIIAVDCQLLSMLEDGLLTFDEDTNFPL